MPHPFRLIIVCGTFTGMWAQPGLVSAPRVGFVYDEGVNAIRTIRGIPGASILGEAINPGSAVKVIALSTRQQFALGQGNDGRLMLLRFGTGTVETKPISTVLSPNGRVVLSPSGASALLLDSGVQVITGLLRDPVVTDIAAPATANSSVALAISDDGQRALISSAAAPGDPVWMLTRNGAELLPAPGSITAAAFQDGGTDAVGITRGGDLYLIPAQSAPRQVLVAEARIADPVAVYFAADGQHVYVASRSGTMSIIDLAEFSVASVSCNCAPSTLDRLNTGTVFRVNEVSNGPMWLFDAANGSPRMWFVPPGEPAAAVGSDQ